MFAKLFASATVAHAHCDLYCGVYDPAQAKIEALSCLKTLQKYQDSDDEHFRTRCIIVVEARAERTFADVLRERISEPCGAVTLQDDDVRRIIRHRAQGYVRVGGELRNNLAALELPSGAVMVRLR